MGYMNFRDPALEKLFKNFKWTRNNTIQLFDKATSNNILDFKQKTVMQSKFTFQPLLYQFQCIITTTDTYYRKLSTNKNQDFGILVKDNQIVAKSAIAASEIKELLSLQLNTLEKLLRSFDSEKTLKYIDLVQIISNHEYLHQGQMIIYFRESGNKLPERFKKAWAL